MAWTLRRRKSTVNFCAMKIICDSEIDTMSNEVGWRNFIWKGGKLGEVMKNLVETVLSMGQIDLHFGQTRHLLVRYLHSNIYTLIH